jgi:DNA-binding GntR family transcriptional regulator
MKTAKYQKVVDYLREEIASGRLRPGDKVPTEEELCRKFGYSRMTVNKALVALSDSGYLKRIPGKGSFVESLPHVSKDLSSSTSFTQDMRKIGLTAGAKLVNYQVINAASKPKVRDYLKLQDQDLMHYFIRIRTGDEIPIAVSYTYISAKIVPAIDVDSLNNSFYAYLDKIGVDRLSSGMELSAVPPNEEEKEWLHIDNSVALLCARHITYTSIGNKAVPFEYIETYYNGDMYSYTTNMADINHAVR